MKSTTLMTAIASLLLVSAAAEAQLVEIDDPALPASDDGFNLTQDLATGLEWLDLTVTAGRTFDDLIGLDGTDEFAPGGDFEGFRHAFRSEIHGYNSPDYATSLYVNFGFTSNFTSPGGYVVSKDFLNTLGCLANCNGLYGVTSGVFELDDDGVPEPRWMLAEALQSAQGINVGRLDGEGTPNVLTSTAFNGSSSAYGHFLVRVPEPGFGALLMAGVTGLLFRRPDALPKTR